MSLFEGTEDLFLSDSFFPCTDSIVSKMVAGFPFRDSGAILDY